MAKHRGWFYSKSLWALFLGASLLLCPVARADEARYIYDDLGRIVRAILSDGKVAIYQYDAVGNLLGIFRTTGGIGAPIINNISPLSFAAGGTQVVTIDGSNLSSALLTIDNPEIRVIGVRSSSDRVTADLAIPNPTRFGTTLLTVKTSAGSASGEIQIAPPPLVLSRLTPSTGLPGDEIIIEGAGFGTTPEQTRVRFMGESGFLSVTPRTFPPPTATKMTVIVPEGVIPSDVTVTVGTQISNPFPFKVPIRLLLDTPIVGKGQTAILTAILPTPAPSPGLLLILVSDRLAIATVLSPIFIPSGARTATATVVGVAVGEAQITASSQGFETGSISFQVDTSTISLPPNLTVGPGRSVSFPVILSRVAPPGGLRVVLTTEDTTIATVVSPLLIPEGETTRNAKVTGVNLGGTRISAITPGYAKGETFVSVSLTLSLSPSSLGLPPGSTRRASLRLSSPAPVGGLTLSLVSTNPAIAAFSQTQVTIPSGQLSANLLINAFSLGATSIRANHPKLLQTEMTVFVRADFSTVPIIIGTGCQTIRTISLLDPAPIGGVRVGLMVNDPTIASISSTQLNFLEGETEHSITIVGKQDGATTLSLSAPGFPTRARSILVPVPQVTLVTNNVPNTLSTISPPRSINIELNLTQTCQQGLSADTAVSLSSSDPAVLSVSTPAMIKAGTRSSSATITVQGEGQARILATAPGLPPVATNLISVTKPKILGPSIFPLGKGLKKSLTVSLSEPAPLGGVTLSLTATPLGLFGLDPTGPITISQGMQSAVLTLIGQGEGTTTLSVQSPGFVGATIPITITTPSFKFQGPSARLTTLSPPNRYSLSIDPPGSGVPILPPTPVTVTSSEPSVLTTSSPVNILADTFQGDGVVTPSSAGTSILSALAPGFSVATSQPILVTQPRLDLLPHQVTIGKGLSPVGALGNFFLSPTLQLSDPAPQQGVIVTLLSGNTGIADISPTTLVFASGEREKPITMTARDLGTATITASAPGWLADTNTISVVTPTLIAAAPVILFRTVSVPKPFHLFTGISTGPFCGFGCLQTPASDLVISVISSDPSVIRVDATAIIPAGVHGSSPIFMTPVGLGTATISFSAPGGVTGTPFGVTVEIPKLILTPSELFARPMTSNNLILSLNDPAPPSGLIVELESSAPDVITVPASVLIPPLATSISIPITAGSEGSTIVTVMATGFIGTQSEITVEPLLLTGVIAQAEVGDPVDTLLPSANGGQVVSVTGINLRPTDLVLIQISSPDGSTREAQVPIISVSTGQIRANFVVPFNAVTGRVGAFGASDSFLLQIVPKIVDGVGPFKPGGDFHLFGNGFVEGESRIVIGSQELIDDSPEAGPDVTEEGGLQRFTFPLPEISGPTIKIKTVGGESNLLTVGPIALNGVEASSTVGQPADSGFPSANLGQLIKIFGEGLRSNHFLLVPTATAPGFVAVPLLSVQGNSAFLFVPPDAISGSVRLYGAPEEIRLQIVPKLSGATGSLTAGSRLDITGNGFVAGETEVLLGETVIPASIVGVESATRLNITLPDTFGTTLRIKTTGGMSNSILLPLSGGIISVSDLGIPADPATPSANIGQTITIIGENFNSPIHAEFLGVNDLGIPITINASPFFISPDGRFLTILVPTGAVAGIVRLIATVNGELITVPVGRLQVVPTAIEFSLPLGDIFIPGTIGTAIGSGFVKGGTSMVIEGSPFMASDVFDMGTRMVVPITSAISEEKPIFLETAGGKSNPLLPTFEIQEIELNDTPTLSQPILFGIKVIGTIDVERNDKDFYKTTVGPGISMEVHLSPNIFCSETRLTILTEQGEPVASASSDCPFFEDGTVPDDDLILTVPPKSEATTYLILVESASQYSYTLRVRRVPSEVEVNDLFEMANPIDRSREGRITPPGDIDFYSMDVNFIPSEDVFVEISLAASLAASSLGSPFRGRITLYDSDGITILAQNEFPSSDPLGPDPVIKFFPNRTGRFFIAVDSPFGEGGEDFFYLLFVKVKITPLRPE